MLKMMPEKGWSKNHHDINSNDWYDENVAVHQPYVDVVVPEEVLKAYRWQSSVTMLKSMPENMTLYDIFSNLERAPRAVLDIACGIGRCSVYLSKRYGWTDTHFYMVDSTADNPRYGVDEKGRKDFYNDMSATELYCTKNGISPDRLHLIDAQREDLSSALSGVTIDIAYSFMAFGFHWDFNHYLPTIAPFIAPGGLVIFGTRGYDQGSGLGYKGRNFTNRQLAAVDQSVFRVIRDARVPERYKASVVVLQKRTPTQRVRDHVFIEREEK